MPDVCKVPAPPGPPVPGPFPNNSKMTSAVATSVNVLTEGKPMIVMTSKLPVSDGDEQGVAGGVTSNMVKGETMFKAGSSKVFVEGKKAVVLGAPTTHNGTNANAVGTHVAPSQTKVIING
jgi:hypothetical protein